MFCCLGDCSREECHHCFPVKFCKYNHKICNDGASCYDVDLYSSDICVTGCAGFIGHHVVLRLLETGHKVWGIDNMNDYYDVSMKERNLALLIAWPTFNFVREDVGTTDTFKRFKPKHIIHLASMAGVRYSIENPQAYIDNNISAFVHLLEQAKDYGVTRVVYASSSSVYGMNDKVPFSESDPIDKCNSPYACSKYAMETFARMYEQLYDVDTVGMRFFTVYGPRGRPDMAPHKFLSAIRAGTEIQRFGDGTSSRDYTYIDDIVNGIIGATFGDRVENFVYNLGNSTPVTLNTFIETCEAVCGKNANVVEHDMPMGDVPLTYADISLAKRDFDYDPKTSLIDGLGKMEAWLAERAEEGSK